MNADQVWGIVRTVLSAAGGYFVAKGVSNDSTMEIIVSGIVALVGVVWGYINSKTIKQ